ncbi:MAG: hypothetical protein K2M67_05940 [Muribaculaceae bacterium]|nr:hypothetical protein [Muribaculaceae bacterium]
MKKSLMAGAVILSTLAFASCNSEENSIEDYPLNYKITEVKATKNIPVGCILTNPYGDLDDAGRWERLTEEYDAVLGHIGPNMQPAAGHYRFMGSNEEEQDDYSKEIGRMVEEMKVAGIDFLITPATRERKQLAPDNIDREDVNFLNIISGRRKDLSWRNDGSMKYAIQINMQNFSNANGFSSYSSALELRPDTEYTDAEGNKVTLTMWNRFISYVRSLAQYMADDTYYCVDGDRPVVLLREPDKFYVQDVEGLYADMRNAIKEVTGKNPYIIAQIPNWTIVPRFEMTVMPGKLDAVTERSLANLNSNMDRYYMWDILMNENYKYNVQYLKENHPGMDFIPSVSSGYSGYVHDMAYDRGDLLPTEADLRKRCWIAKMNLTGNRDMVIVDSFNDWGYANFIESSDPSYGKGVGDAFLKAIKSEFKVN